MPSRPVGGTDSAATCSIVRHDNKSPLGRLSDDVNVKNLFLAYARNINGLWFDNDHDINGNRLVVHFTRRSVAQRSTEVDSNDDAKNAGGSKIAKAIET